MKYHFYYRIWLLGTYGIKKGLLSPCVRCMIRMSESCKLYTEGRIMGIIVGALMKTRKSWKVKGEKWERIN